MGPPGAPHLVTFSAAQRLNLYQATGKRDQPMTDPITREETYRQYAIEEYVIGDEPFYLPVGDEVTLFKAAYAQKIPVLLKGPTGSGKTRFVEYMAFKLGRPLTIIRDVAKEGASE